MTHETRYYVSMNAYEFLIETDDLDAIDAVNELFTNVVITDAPESGAHSYVRFDATDDALVAYATRFGLLADLDDDELFDRV